MTSDSHQPVLNIVFRDRDTLYASYMPFLGNGGLFIPTDRPYEIGDMVSLLIQLPDEVEPQAASGRVVWLNPRATAGRPAGIGVHFDKQVNSLSKRIEVLLASLLKSERPTYTM
jgi:type IV pilus assembly protein PilZ